LARRMARGCRAPCDTDALHTGARGLRVFCRKQSLSAGTHLYLRPGARLSPFHTRDLAAAHPGRGPMTALFTPGYIGAVEIPNRVVMPAMTTRLADSEGYVTEGTVAYFAARAAGGTGLITVEMASPERVGRHRFHELGIYDDRFVP